MPRAYLVGDYRVLPDPGRRLRYLRSSTFDPRRQVVLEEPPQLEPGALEGEAPIVPRFVAYGSEQIEIELDEHPGGLLVLSDTYYPGWRAYVDGRESGILRANHVFRAIEVPPAARHVTFRFQSPSFRLGALVSAIGALAWLVWLAWLARRPGAGLLPLRPRPEPEADVGPFAGPGRQAKVWALQAVLVVVIHALATQGPRWAHVLERSRALDALGAN